ncbi:MAG: sigma-70 family RNA polymerase sigma factor [Oscillospiraceae bacterium]|nr:sigma-70 family RNA polymerase sigma factor [Oscillospiraceae bacterium]
MVEECNHLSDLELLARSSGSHDAMRALIIRYTRLVRICARPLFLAGGDHEDLVQEGMIGLLDAIRSFEPDTGTPFESYAAICIRRRMISAVRSASARKHAPLNDSVPLGGSCMSSTDPEAEFIDREAHQARLNALYPVLSPIEESVLRLYLEGCSYREIAQRVNRPQKSVDNAIQRIRRKATKIIGEDGDPV